MDEDHWTGLEWVGALAAQGELSIIPTYLKELLAWLRLTPELRDEGKGALLRQESEWTARLPGGGRKDRRSGKEIRFHARLSAFLDELAAGQRTAWAVFVCLLCHDATRAVVMQHAFKNGGEPDYEELCEGLCQMAPSFTD